MEPGVLVDTVAPIYPIRLAGLSLPHVNLIITGPCFHLLLRSGLPATINMTNGLSIAMKSIPQILWLSDAIGFAEWEEKRWPVCIVLHDDES